MEQIVVREGGDVPQGFEELIGKKRLSEAVNTIVESLERHETTIFGLS